MKKPPALADVTLAKDGGEIHTFSNGSEFMSWAANNCDRCKWFDPEKAGQCAFEAAAFLHMVTPELARLFGWIESAEYPGDFDAPDECAFFVDKDKRDPDREPRRAPDPSPSNLSLFADQRTTHDVTVPMAATHRTRKVTV